MSGAEQQEYVFTWRIKNYLSCYQNNAEFIESPTFGIGKISDNTEFCLRLFPKADSSVKKDEHFISCFLKWKALNPNINTTTISYSIELVDEKDSVLKSLKVRNKAFNKENQTWGWAKFFDAEELYEKLTSWMKDDLTIRCRIKMEEECKQILSETISCTNIEVDRYCLEWSMQLPSLYEHFEYIVYPISDSFKLDITLNITLEGMNILISFGEDQSPLQLTFTFTISDKLGSKLGSKRALHFCENEETWKFPKFITKEMLKNCEINSSQYDFKLKCEVCISKKQISNYIERFEFMAPRALRSIPKDKPVLSLQTEFQNLFVNKNYSDVKIRGRDCEFSAHKIVLRVRSPVFAAMFDQDMLENKTGVVDIPDLDEKLLKAFLEFLYSETVDTMDYGIASKLMLAADKYQVASLVEKCASFLKSIVSVENVCEIIAIADLINCEILKSYALNFIKINAAKILPTADWSEWIEGNVKLATFILSELSTFIGSGYKLI